MIRSVLEGAKRGAVYRAIILAGLAAILTLASWVMGRPTVFVFWAMLDIPWGAFEGALFGAILGAILAAYRMRKENTSVGRRPNLISWLLGGAFLGLIWGLLFSVLLILGPFEGNINQAFLVGSRVLPVSTLGGVASGVILGLIRLKRFL